jgi:hypothetical protein
MDVALPTIGGAMPAGHRPHSASTCSRASTTSAPAMPVFSGLGVTVA